VTFLNRPAEEDSAGEMQAFDDHMVSSALKLALQQREIWDEAQRTLSNSYRLATRAGLGAETTAEAMNTDILGIPVADIADRAGDIHPAASKSFVDSLKHLQQFTVTALARLQALVRRTCPSDRAALQKAVAEAAIPVINEFMNTAIPSVVLGWCEAHKYAAAQVVQDIIAAPIVGGCKEMIDALPGQMASVQRHFRADTTVDKVLMISLGYLMNRKLRKANDEATARIWNALKNPAIIASDASS